MNDYAEQAYLSMQTPPEAAAPPGVNMLVNPRARANRADIARRLMGTQYSDQEREGVIARMQADAEDAQPMTATYGGKSFQMAQSPRRDLALSYLEQLRNTKSDNLRSEDEKWRKDLIANRDKTGQDRWNQTMGERTRAAQVAEKRQAMQDALERDKAMPGIEAQKQTNIRAADPTDQAIARQDKILAVPNLTNSAREAAMREIARLSAMQQGQRGQRGMPGQTMPPELMAPGTGPLAPPQGGSAPTGNMFEVDPMKALSHPMVAQFTKAAQSAATQVAQRGLGDTPFVKSAMGRIRSNFDRAVKAAVGQGVSEEDAKRKVLEDILEGLDLNTAGAIEKTLTTSTITSPFPTMTERTLSAAATAAALPLTPQWLIKQGLNYAGIGR